MKQRSIAIAVGVRGERTWIRAAGHLEVAHAGGTIVGKVTYNGKSEEKEFLFSKFPNPKFCSKNPHKELVKGDKRIMPTIRVGTRWRASGCRCGREGHRGQDLHGRV